MTRPDRPLQAITGHFRQCWHLGHFTVARASTEGRRDVLPVSGNTKAASADAVPIERPRPDHSSFVACPVATGARHGIATVWYIARRASRQARCPTSIMARQLCGEPARPGHTWLCRYAARTWQAQGPDRRSCGELFAKQLALVRSSARSPRPAPWSPRQSTPSVP